jgi:class 3 adenylate cyclase
MFSDLVGSTALSASMDPEDLREVISAYKKCVAETVRRFGGYVAKHLGGGVLYCSPVLRHAAEPVQAANCRSAAVF